MSAWWWVAIGFVAWLGAALAMGLLLSPFFRGRVGSSHRMISTYLNSLTGHGLVLDRAVEPPPSPDMERRRPAAAAPVPFYFVGRAVALNLPASR